MFIFGAGDAKVVKVGSNLQMNVVKDGQPYTNVSYAVDNDDYASIDAFGVLTGKAEGDVVVTATDATNDSIKATTTISVLNELPVERLILFGEADRDYIDVAGGTLQMHTKAMPGDEFYSNVTYSVNDDTIAEISDTGLLTAKANGTVTVTVTDKTNIELKVTKDIIISNQA